MHSTIPRKSPIYEWDKYSSSILPKKSGGLPKPEEESVTCAYNNPPPAAFPSTEHHHRSKREGRRKIFSLSSNKYVVSGSAPSRGRRATSGERIPKPSALTSFLLWNESIPINTPENARFSLPMLQAHMPARSGHHLIIVQCNLGHPLGHAVLMRITVSHLVCLQVGQ